jgi:L-amino acid N-acyltransferase YncA
MSIRFACAADGAALLHIYAQYIGTPVTFECTLPRLEEFARRIETISACYPYLVWEEGGFAVGYAYAHRQMEREAYQWNAELSVYLDRAHTSRGIGSRLYRALMDILRLQGVKNVYGGVTLPNEKSVRLHESLGFERLGTYRATGFKCGQWHDVAWFQKQIAPCGSQPAPVVPITSLPPSRLEEILRAYSQNA